MEQHRGGTMRLVARVGRGHASIRTSTTRCNNWQLYQSIYDGLVTFKKARGRRGLQDRARSRRGDARAADDGKTYVFKLRKGIKFSNGQDADRRRTSSPPSSASSRFPSPTSGTFYNGIVGADDA